MIQRDEKEENHQRQQKTDKGLDIFRKQEQIFGYRNLGKDLCVVHKTAHPAFRGF